MHNKENKPLKILTVDDDINVLQVLDVRLTNAGFEVDVAQSGRDAIIKLNKSKFDCMITDMSMPGMSGMELIQEAQSIQPGIPIVILTAHGTLPEEIKAVKAGAVDYMTKPFDGRSLVYKLNTILSINQQIKSKVEDFDVVKSSVMKEFYSLVQKVARGDISVLIIGENGVGKDRIAHLIHQLSPRSKKPFVVVDRNTIPANLLESEVFGHIRGSSAYAASDRKGLIEKADKGTLFLDEVDNLSVDMQVRLLEFLEGRKIGRIGGLKESTVDCRVIVATNSDLSEDIKSGNFRKDLYYRLRVVTLKVPPLRDRKEDIPILAKTFAQAFADQHGTPMVDLPDETISYLCDYTWPGNVREMKNAIEAGIILCRENTLKPKDLHLSGQIADVERNAIIEALEQTGGVQKEAATLLRISLRAIHYKIKKYDIDTSSIRARGR